MLSRFRSSDGLKLGGSRSWDPLHNDIECCQRMPFLSKFVHALKRFARVFAGQRIGNTCSHLPRGVYGLHRTLAGRFARRWQRHAGNARLSCPGCQRAICRQPPKATADRVPATCEVSLDPANAFKDSDPPGRSAPFRGSRESCCLAGRKTRAGCHWRLARQCVWLEPIRKRSKPATSLNKYHLACSINVCTL